MRWHFHRFKIYRIFPFNVRSFQFMHPSWSINFSTHSNVYEFITSINQHYTAQHSPVRYSRTCNLLNKMGSLHTENLGFCVLLFFGHFHFHLVIKRAVPETMNKSVNNMFLICICEWEPTEKQVNHPIGSWKLEVGI